LPVRAAVLVAPGKPLETWDLPDPPLEPGAVLLDTIASEVCGTAVHLFHGRLAGVPYPIIPGHVSVGKVLEARDVTVDVNGQALRAGDVVTFYDVHEVCGRCWHCLVARQPNRCPSRRVYGITYSARDGLLRGGGARHAPNGRRGPGAGRGARGSLRRGVRCAQGGGHGDRDRRPGGPSG